ncbi:hypothetical protein V5F29_05295 [Xanthobacter aminoxidans]|uniref:hypothetical protein n=1 Tax=Xanthobacter aminoxidans TaxID=186280 RepID=UPI003726FA42
MTQAWRPHAHRLEVLLAPLPDGQGGWTIQRSLDGGTNWEDTGLAPDTVIDVSDGYSFQNLIDDFESVERPEDIRTRLFFWDQKKIGWLLTSALFGSDGPDLGVDTRWIHLMPTAGPVGPTFQDFNAFLDFVLRLPWPLMTDSDAPDAVALASDQTYPVAITVDGYFGPKEGREWFDEIRMPSRPNVLLIISMAHPPDENPTEGAAHRDALKKLLASDEIGAQRVQIATTLADVDALLGGAADSWFAPQIIYYYGHARAAGPGTDLFIDNRWISVGALARALQAQVAKTKVPPVVWINGCQSGAAQINSAVRVLAPYASVVIATRTVAVVSDARALGEMALPRMAVKGWSPSSAMRDSIKSQSFETIESARWATSIVAVQYRNRTLLAPERTLGLDRESYGDVPLRLDRREPLKDIEDFLRRRMADEIPDVDVVVWSGGREHGPDLFANRFCDLAREQFGDCFPIVHRVELGFDVRLDRPPGDVLDAEYGEALLQALTGRRRRQKPQQNRPKNDRGASAFTEAILMAVHNIIGTEKRVLILDHGQHEPFCEALILKYIEFWRFLHSQILVTGNIMPSHQRLVLAFGFWGNATLAEPHARMVSLAPVDPIDVMEHVSEFNFVYGDSARKGSGIAQETNGAFRQIYNVLRTWIGFPEDEGQTRQGG